MAASLSDVYTFTTTATLGAVFTTTAPASAPSREASYNILSPPHHKPTVYNPNDPIILFIIQVAIIIAISRLLHVFLAKIKQPRVIGEVIGGILLGPTALGRIPGFTANIFPPQSVPYLSLVAEVGLVLFLFLVGMDVDFALFRRNLKVSVAVASAGLAIPFGLGCAVSVGLYNEFVDSSIVFSHFLLFIGTSMSITAFPVLARILSELNLLGDKVGIIVLSAGVANDVIGWILLALTIALVNAASGLVVLYVILCAIGWNVILFFVVRPFFVYICRKSGSFDGHGPTQTVVCLTLMVCLASAWVTQAIGVNAIFGGFCAGLIMPRRNGFVPHLTEKVEDLILALLIPIYFALSGLKTNLGLLNSGIIWAWTFCVMIVAFCGKFFGCAATSRWSGFNFRESCAVGSLMSAKGLIELVVLNIGLQVGVVNQLVFSIFVLEAVTLTFFATPLTLAFYPKHIRTAYVPPSITSTEKTEDVMSTTSTKGNLEGLSVPRTTMVLERLENLSAVMVFTRLIATPPLYDAATGTSHTAPSSLTALSSPLASAPDSTDGDPTTAELKPRETSASFCRIDTIRLVELTDRTSAVMQASEFEETLRNDALSALYGTFCSLNGVNIEAASLRVVHQADYATSVAEKARERESELVVVPWVLNRAHEEGVVASYIPNPLESLFAHAAGGNIPSGATYASFVRDVFLNVSTDIAVFIDRGSTAPASRTKSGSYHLYLPFHGGPDDRACLSLLLRLMASNRGISATVVRFVRAAESTEDDKHLDLGEKGSQTSSASPTAATGDAHHHLTIGSGHGRPEDTIYPGQTNASAQLASESADDIALERAGHAPTAVASRLTLETCNTALPLRSTVVRADALAKRFAQRSRLIVMAGRGRKAAASHRAESTQMLEKLLNEGRAAELGIARSSEVRKGLGEVGTALLVGGAGRNLLIMQSRESEGLRRSAADRA